MMTLWTVPYFLNWCKQDYPRYYPNNSLCKIRRKFLFNKDSKSLCPE